MNRISIVIKQRVNTILDKQEDPREALHHSYVKQTEMLRQDVAEVLTAKKRLEMQKAKLWHYIHTLHEQARRSLDSNMVDIAKVALQHKNANLVQVQSLDKQISEMQAEQVKLEEAEKRLSTKVGEFRSIKEVIKAKYSAAEAQVRIKGIVGISAEMTDVGVALDGAEDKTAKMKAKFQALDEMIASGVPTDYSSNKDNFEAELERITINGSVDEELAKLKAERQRKKK